ncbi:hypothetical protein BH09MYX1_BH09MYX1_67170 [soil metagenome]
MTSALPPVVVRSHLSRAARIAAVAAIGVACGGTTEPPTDGGNSADVTVKDSAVQDAADEIPIGPMYGGPFDSGQQDASADAPEDVKQDITIFPPYGQAPLPPDGWV